jgi:hypothetical protein
MNSRDPKCVLVTDSVDVAEAVVNWLGAQGVPAQVQNSAPEIEVWVQDASRAEEAIHLLKEEQQRLMAARRAERTEDLGPVEMECEDCGRALTFPGAERGTVQNCVHCGAYLDVPGPDDDPDGEEEWNVGEQE